MLISSHAVMVLNAPFNIISAILWQLKTNRIIHQLQIGKKIHLPYWL